MSSIYFYLNKYNFISNKSHIMEDLNIKIIWIATYQNMPNCKVCLQKGVLDWFWCENVINREINLLFIHNTTYVVDLIYFRNMEIFVSFYF